nr:hypothetical protein GCM10020093_047110 [Planobispora longispora]
MVETAVGEAARFEPFRGELVGYCYRLLGSGFEAEDAVQETLLRAWRSSGRYDERRASPRTWLYSIATNVCLDMLRSAQRRALAMDLSRAADAGADIGAPLPEGAWVQPVPDGLVLPADGDPEETAVRRETIRLAFIAALQHLPPRQRAVLILRDVLAWKAEEVAHLLETTVASVTSALQRARATLRAIDTVPGEPFRPSDPAQRELLARYCAAFERHDVAALVALLHEDATMSMPPFAWWLRGRDRIRRRCWIRRRPARARASSRSRRTARRRSGSCGPAPTAPTPLRAGPPRRVRGADRRHHHLPRRRAADPALRRPGRPPPATE